jgi:hypothetical protein
MKAKGWEVTTTDYHFDQEVYSWRHNVHGGNSPTLRIARYVLERYPAFAVLYLIDQLKVASAIRASPGARLVVKQKGTAVVLEEVPGE